MSTITVDNDAIPSKKGDVTPIAPTRAEMNRRRIIPAPTRSLLSQSLVCAAVPAIENEVKKLIRGSVILDDSLSNSTSVPAVDKLYQDLNKNSDDIALLRRKELKLGRLLGRGSFSNVVSIRSVHLLEEASQSMLDASFTSLHNSNVCISYSVDDQEDDETREDHVNKTYAKKEILMKEREKRRTKMRDDVNNGYVRYAVKYLRKSLLKKPRGFVHAAADLIMEAKYLCKFDHPNILKIRGLSMGGINAFKSGGYDSCFLIIDRLFGTLDTQIQDWCKDSVEIMAGAEGKQKLLLQKIDYGLQIGLALQYLHKHRVIYRDLKPQNIGFKDEQFKICQLFDFGLCRELPSGKNGKKTGSKNGSDDNNNSDNINQAFKMSGAGTRTYMAPEIINTHMYNLKADVYSWSMVFYEILTHIRPYGTMDLETHESQVCQRGNRPEIPSDLDFPQSLHEILEQTWDQDFTSRLSMDETVNQLQQIFQEQQVALEEIIASKKATVETTTDEDEGSICLGDSDSEESLIIAIEGHDSFQISNEPLQRFVGRNISNAASSYASGATFDGEISIDFDTRGFFSGADNNSSSGIEVFLKSNDGGEEMQSP